MTEGWGKPVFGGGALRYPEIMSPNFNLANPSASPANSWALLQSGLAYIFGLVLSGGTITGPDYIINSQGIFFYSSTPAAGDLIAWFAPAAGTDQFGNGFTEGLNVGGMGQNIALIPQQNSAFNITTAIAGVLQAVAQLGSGDGSQVVAGLIGSLLLGTSTATKQTTVIGSPLGSTSAAYILLESENDGGTDTPVITFGTVTSPDSGTTLVYTPIATFGPYFLLVYSAASGQTVVTKTTGSGTIPIPVGVATVKGECWGGGGGGGNGWVVAAGAGAEYACEPSLAVTGGGTVSYSVGAAGAGGALSNSSTNPGSAGGNSTLTGTSVTVTAHSGGGGSVGAGGVAGTGSTNTIHFDGGAGGFASSFSGSGGGSSAGTAAPGTAGQGAPSLTTPGAGGVAPAGGGNGGAGGAGGAGVDQGGVPGSAPGGGGGGGGFNANNSAGHSGGAGHAGQVRITYSTGAPTILLSIASASGTDQFGTAYPAGLKLTTGTSEFGGAILLDPVGSPAAPGSGVNVFSNTSGILSTRGTDGNVYLTGRRTINFTGTQTVSSATFVTVTDGTNNFSASVAAAPYKFRARLIYKPSGTTGTPIFGVTGPALSSGGWVFTLQYNGIGGTDPNGGFARYDNASPMASSFSSVSNATLTTALFCSVDIEGTVVFSASGTIAVKAETNSGSNFVIQQGSFFELEPL
jgi:hypothetical protein